MGAGVRMLKSGLFCPGMRRSWTLSRQVSEARFPGKRWLVAGLGNPGMPGTRHSVGMAVLGQIAQRLGVAENWARDSRCAADLALAPFGDAQLVLLRPRRLMNVNGRSVAKAAELFGLSAEEIYLVHDELDKPLGKLALKLGGSARGHNGVRSCISCLNSNAMPRLLRTRWGVIAQEKNSARQQGGQGVQGWGGSRVTEVSHWGAAEHCGKGARVLEGS
uniref:peptidyl-tRNA hydrolase n=1 Tax=Rattus norvegicus TaxID=10116 RepID=A0ABK0L7Q7_RAT